LKLTDALLLLLVHLTILLLLELTLQVCCRLLFGGDAAEEVAGRDEQLENAACSGRALLLLAEAECSRLFSLLLLRTQSS